MKFEETNCKITVEYGLFFASCTAAWCPWVGPYRDSESSAKRDAVRHHKSDKGDS